MDLLMMGPKFHVILGSNVVGVALHEQMSVKLELNSAKQHTMTAIFSCRASRACFVWWELMLIV
jgi:hypothetical protein